MLFNRLELEFNSSFQSNIFSSGLKVEIVTTGLLLITYLNITLKNLQIKLIQVSP